MSGAADETKPGTGRNPAWAEAELVLALELYLSEGTLDSKHQSVVGLSDLLNRLPLHVDRPDAVRFRNPNGVALKLANFAALDPSYHGKGMSRGGKRDAEVWDRFAGDESALREAAARIRAGLPLLASTPGGPSPPSYASIAVEAINVPRFTIERPASTAEAERREQQLVVAYQSYLEAQQHRVARHRYDVEGSLLVCDLFDETEWCLFEAKGDVSREAIRIAVGQLLDYRRFYADRNPALAVLLPRRPSDDLLRFLRSVDVRAVFKTASGDWIRE